MPRDGELGDEAPRAKGSAFQGVLASLKKLGWFEETRRGVSEPTRSLMDSPPLVSEWVPNKQLIEVYEVVAQLRGLDGVAAVAKGATDTMNRISQPLFSGLLRLFGTSPSTLLSRMNILVRPVSRGGAQYAYREIERGLGEMIVTFPIRDEAKPCTYKTLEASLEVVAQMCAPKASVALKSVKTDVDPIQAIYEVRW